MKTPLSIICFFIASCLNGQSINYNHKIVDTLTSASFWGRGYTKDGMAKVATFLANEFKKIGLAPLNSKDFLQKFSFSVNTFPDEMEVVLNGKKLVAGIDYIITADSRGAKQKGYLEQIDKTAFIDEKNKIIFSVQKKLTWDASQKVEDYTTIQLDSARLKAVPKTYEVNIKNKFIKKFDAANVCAIAKGTSKPDSFIFITAHYDHLGGMGSETYFPGANDNASGVALLLSLAKYYSAHPQKYSIAFILFAAEEIGLLGSKYFTENPLVPLKNIRFLTNTDLAGTGIDGITVVNATIFQKEFAIMQKINNEGKYLKAINPRGKAANSDHYFFTEKGVPSFFFYTLGGIAAYHDVFDKAATLPLNKQDDLLKLLIKFNEALQY